MAVTKSQIAHMKSRRVVEYHPKIVESVKRHGEILGLLHEASSEHRAHVSKKGSSPEHHHVSAAHLKNMVFYANQLEASALKQVAIAKKLKEIAQSAHDSHVSATSR